MKQDQIITISLPPRHRAVQGVAYPNAYTWFVMLSAMDVMLTWCVLHAGGYEVNPLARIVIVHGGLHGLLVYKFALVILVIVICEYLASRRRPVGRWLAQFSVALTALPVTAAIVQLFTLFYPLS